MNMTNQDLRKLNRKELLELLLKQTVRVKELETELQEKTVRLQEMEQTLNDINLLQQAKTMIKEMETRCAEREAAAEKKIIEANNLLARARENKLAVEKTNAPEKKEPEKAVQPKDILDDFFSGVIGKK